MYYAVTMRNSDDLNHSYNVYVEAYDKKEARICAKNELLEDEQYDDIWGVEEISEEEYIKGCKLFGDGVRAIM